MDAGDAAALAALGGVAAGALNTAPPVDIGVSVPGPASYGGGKGWHGGAPQNAYQQNAWRVNNSYGGGYGKAKGKTKFFKGPREEKPMVNPNHINPAKDPLNGGISFKNILQEQVSKRKGTPIIQGDIVYTTVKVKGGRAGDLLLPCLGTGEEFRFQTEPDKPGSDEKHANQIVASQALEALFPDVNIAVHEAHLSAAEKALDPENCTPDGTPSAAVDPEGEPKGLLNSRVQIAVNRPVMAGDIVYETTWNFHTRGYTSILRVKALEPSPFLAGAPTAEGEEAVEAPVEDVLAQVFTAEAPNSTDKRQAEKAAARLALESNKVLFEEALAKREEKKAREARQKHEAAQRHKGLGKGGKNDRQSFGHNRDQNSRRDRSRSYPRRDRSRSYPRRERSRSRGRRGRSRSRDRGYAPPSYGMPPPGYGLPPGYPPGYGYPPPAYGAPPLGHPPPAYGVPPPAYGALPPGYPGVYGLTPPGYGAPPPAAYGAPPPAYGVPPYGGPPM